jgi:hypothetical protein
VNKRIAASDPPPKRPTDAQQCNSDPTGSEAAAEKVLQENLATMLRKRSRAKHTDAQASLRQMVAVQEYWSTHN